jgi:hypothetical protein
MIYRSSCLEPAAIAPKADESCRDAKEQDVTSSGQHKASYSTTANAKPEAACVRKQSGSRDLKMYGERRQREAEVERSDKEE